MTTPQHKRIRRKARQLSLLYRMAERSRLALPAAPAPAFQLPVLRPAPRKP